MMGIKITWKSYSFSSGRNPPDDYLRNLTPIEASQIATIYEDHKDCKAVKIFNMEDWGK